MNYDVSIVIATYNRVDKLKNTIDSILAQDYANDYEIIIVDDGSADETEAKVNALVKKYWKIRYFKQEHKGPAAARNLGIKKSKYDIVAFTDDDCLVPEDWLKKLVDGYKKYPNVVGVGGYIEAKDETLKNNVFAQWERFEAREIYGLREEEVVGGFECPGMGTANASFKKKILNEVNGFDEFFKSAAGEDMDLKYRISKGGYKFLYSPIKVTHMQDYNWNRFIKQSWTRGIGSKYFDMKYERSTILESIAKIFFSPLIFIYFIFTSSINLQNIKMHALRTIRLFVASTARIIG